MPVVFACRGCEHDAAARRVVAMLEQRGLGEAAVAGANAAKARARFPIYVIEGCGKSCAAQWLAGHGVRPQRSFVLDPQGDAEAQAAHISAELASGK